MVTPDIHQIVKKSLSIGKNILFYLPRLINLNELFEILYDVTEKDCIFLDIHILESANKIKAILLIFGPSISTINKNDMQNFISMLTEHHNLKDSKSSENDSDYKATTVINRKMSNSGDSYSPEYVITENEFTSNSFNYSNTDNSTKLNNKNSNLSHSKTQSTHTNNIDNESPHIILWKIYSIIGLKKFFESLIKFKEKYEPLDLKNGYKNYLPKAEKLQDLITFLLKEVLTDKQITRIHL